MPLRLSALLFALVAAGSACRSHAPTQPDALAFSETAPANLSVNATAGRGPSGGTALVIARVQNGRGTNLPGVRVAFTTDAGSLSTASAETMADGTATLSLTAATTATITASTGALTAHALVQSNPYVPVVPPIPDGPAPPPPNPPAPGPLSVTLSVMPGVTGTATTFGLASPGISRAVWSFGDGASETTTAPSTGHIYAAAGSYTASVTITDTVGRTASNSQTFAITDAPPPPPPPAPSYAVTVTTPRTSIALDESVTLTASAPPLHGAPPATSYAWDCDGNGTAEVTEGSNSHICTYSVSGTIQSRVAVNGGTATGSGFISITVATAPPLLVTIDAPTPSVVLVNAPITFRAWVSSTGAVPTLLQWEWDDDGDGKYETTVSGASNPNDHRTSYGSVGEKRILVRVTETTTGRTVTSSPRTVTVE